MPLGTTVTALDEQGPLVHAVFDDGSTGAYDLVVGADGMRSWVRTVVFGGAAPRFLGQAGWRFFVDGGGEISAWTVQLGRATAFLMIPLGNGRIYCYADADASAAIDPTGGDPGKLAQLYAGFAEPVPTIARERLPNGDPPYFSPIQEVVHKPWVAGRIVLVGDGAHAMSPNMAEGVGMALEDGLVLAETIAADRYSSRSQSTSLTTVRFIGSCDGCGSDGETVVRCRGMGPLQPRNKEARNRPGRRYRWARCGAYRAARDICSSLARIKSWPMAHGIIAGLPRRDRSLPREAATHRPRSSFSYDPPDKQRPYQDLLPGTRTPGGGRFRRCAG